MRASTLAGYFGIILFIIGSTLALIGNESTRLIGGLISIGSIIWSIKWGQHLRGWIGRPLEEIQKEEALVSAAMESKKNSNGEPLTTEEFIKLLDRQKELWEEARQFNIEHQK